MASSGSSGNSSGGSSSGVVITDCNSPVGATTLCDVQNPNSSNHPSVGTEVTFPDPLVVASDVFTLSSSNGVIIKAFFVTEGAGGSWRGALVKGAGDLIDALSITKGAQVNLQIRVEEYAGTGTGSETQLDLVGANVLPSPGVIPGAAVLGVDAFASDVSAEPWEGVLVRVENATAIRFDSGARTEFGAFRLQGGLLVDDLLYQYEAGVGETFSSITGFVRYTFDGRWALIPRDAADVVSSGNPLAAQDVGVVAIQDPANAQNLPHCVAPAQCDLVRLTNMVVVSYVRVADKDNAGKASLYSVFIQDPTALDANGEPLEYSGVKVVFARTGLQSTFPFTTYGTDNFPDTRDHPDDWPKPGDIITLEGTPQEYFDMTQVGMIRVLNKVGTVMDATLPFATVPKAKAMEGAALSGLAAGNVGVVDCPALQTVPPGGDNEKWEGVLVEARNVSTTAACVPTPNNSTVAPSCIAPDFGYFRITGDVEVGTGQGVFYADRCPTGSTCTCGGATVLPNDTRMLGQNFTSITGVMDYSFSVFRLSPRVPEDLVAAP